MFLVVGYFAVSIPQIVYLKFNPWIILQIFIHWYGCFKKIFWVHWIQIQRTPIGLLMQLQVKQLVSRWKVMCTLSPRRIDHADLRMYHWQTVYPPPPNPRNIFIYWYSILQVFTMCEFPRMKEAEIIYLCEHDFIIFTARPTQIMLSCTLSGYLR